MSQKIESVYRPVRSIRLGRYQLSLSKEDKVATVEAKMALKKEEDT